MSSFIHFSGIKLSNHYQLQRFVEIITEGLIEPKRKSIPRMLFGIQASRDIKLSEIARSLSE